MNSPVRRLAINFGEEESLIWEPPSKVTDKVEESKKRPSESGLGQLLGVYSVIYTPPGAFGGVE